MICVLTTNVNRGRHPIVNFTNFRKTRTLCLYLSIFGRHNNSLQNRHLTPFLGGSIVLPRSGLTTSISTMMILFTLMSTFPTTQAFTSGRALNLGRLLHILTSLKMTRSRTPYRFYGTDRRTLQINLPLNGNHRLHFPLYHGLKENRRLQRRANGIITILNKG